ncbi:MAG: cytidine deaminase [Bacteroidia bacterium]|jgi:cytidine deaminase|nr:cytidine deaminase [Bacteroidia bacterium]
MKSKATTLTITTNLIVYKSMEDLPKEDFELLKLAKKAVKSAYAPYSQFFVGAAILLENGKISIGNNQENAAYPSGLCAERVAIFHASAKYPNIPIKKIAVSVASKTQIINEPVSPCGGCRQVISEYEMKYDSPISIIMSGETGQIYVSDSIENLLPIMFNKKHLK